MYHFQPLIYRLHGQRMCWFLCYWHNLTFQFFYGREMHKFSVFLPMWENDLRNQIKRDILVDFHLYLLLGLVFEGPCIVCKLFQHFLICWTYSSDYHPCHWLRFVLGYSASKQATCLKRWIERKVFRSPIKYFLLS